MKQTITINELWCEAIIGIYPHERSASQPLRLDVEVDVDASEAIIHDDIVHTLDYDHLAHAIKDHVEGHSYQLLERLLQSLLELIATYPQAESVRLCLTKPGALQDIRATVRLSGEWQRTS